MIWIYGMEFRDTFMTTFQQSYPGTQWFDIALLMPCGLIAWLLKSLCYPVHLLRNHFQSTPHFFPENSHWSFKKNVYFLKSCNLYLFTCCTKSKSLTVSCPGHLCIIHLYKQKRAYWSLTEALSYVYTMVAVCHSWLCPTHSFPHTPSVEMPWCCCSRTYKYAYSWGLSLQLDWEQSQRAGV